MLPSQLALTIFLVPKLNAAVPTGADDFARFVRMPEDAHRCAIVHAPVDVFAVVGLPPGDDFVRFEVPNRHFPFGASAHQIAHVGRKIHPARVSGVDVPFERFPAKPPQLFGDHLEHQNFIVHRLADDPFFVRRLRHERHRMQAGLLDQLRVDGDSPFPNAHRFVVGRRAKPTVLVEKRDRVDGAQMPVVLLDDLAVATDVPLQDFLIVHTRQEQILLVFVRVELHHVRGDVLCEPLDAFTRFRIPKFYETIV